MPEVVTNIVINAPDTEVWRALTDLPAYAGWNPMLRKVGGTLRIDEPLTITRVKPDGSEVEDRPTVTMYRPGREIRWRARHLAPGLLDIERGLKLERLDENQTRFVHWETRSGLFAYLVQGGSDTALREQFEMMNLALKTHVQHELAARQQPATAPRASQVRVATHEPVAPTPSHEQHSVAGRA